MWKKLLKNTDGFTLTEVMIGIMILTVAIVSATNLLVGLISTNQNNVTSLQAYYLAQEGLEAVRNIRDTNWLHNQDWLGLGSDALWGGHFEVVGNEYSVNLEGAAFNRGITAGLTGDISLLNSAKPWSITDGSTGLIYKYSNGPDVYLTSAAGDGENSGFKRIIVIKPYEDSSGSVSSGYVLVESKITWQLGSKNRELTLSNILTNWKGGAL